MVEPSESMIGRVVGDFTIQELIGQGGMARVYRALQRSVNRYVALKVINLRENSADPRFKERFANEAAVIASLEHLHILPVFAYGIEDDIAYLAMRLLSGGSLRDRLQAEEFLQPEDAVRIFQQIAEGLAYAHSRGIVHRDIKPANILMDNKGNAYLTDFGLAKSVDSGDSLTREDSIIGTLAYMSPEQIRGEPIDHRADVYSLGLLFYQMVTGRVPFEQAPGEDSVALIYKHLEKMPALPSSINPALPRDVDGVLLRALAKAREDRYDNVLELATALRRACGVTTTEVHRVPASLLPSSSEFPKPEAAIPTSVTPQPAPASARQNWLLGVVVFGGGLLLILLALLLIQPQLNRPTERFRHVVDAAGVAEWDQLAPTRAQIEEARRTLGTDGFIAVVACNRSSEYHATLTRETADRARSYGLAVRIYDSDSDAYQQRVEMEKALGEGAAAFILCPLEYQLIDETLRAIEAAHLPLVSHVRYEKTYGGVVTASEVTNFEMGFAAGAFAGQIIREERDGHARVVVLDFPDLEAIVERADGLEAGVKSIVPEAQIIGRFRGATAEAGYQSIRGLIDAGTQFDAIVSINDAGSYGAIHALEEAGITPQQVFISSIDAETLAVEFINRGHYIRGSLTVGRQATAIASVDVMTRMLAGETVPQTITIPLGEVIQQQRALPPEIQ